MKRYTKYTVPVIAILSLTFAITWALASKPVHKPTVPPSPPPESTSENTVAAAPSLDLIHPGVLRYLREIGAIK